MRTSRTRSRSRITETAVSVIAVLSVGAFGMSSAVAAPGDELWATGYTGPGDREDTAYAVAAMPDGSGVVVTGDSLGGTTAVDFATVSYLPTGAERWASRYDGPDHGNDYSYAVAVTPDGTGVVVTGGSDGGASGGDYATIMYDAATGATRWVARYDGPAGGDDTATAVAVSPNGQQMVVTGMSWGGSTGTDHATVSYTVATGAQRWVARYDGPASGLDAAYAVAVTPDGRSVVVTGSSAGLTSGSDYATVAYSTKTGAARWAKRYNGTGNGSDNARSLTVTPDGTRVVVTGTSWGTGSAQNDYATVAYDVRGGTQRWAKRYNGPNFGGGDYARAIAVTPDGTAVVVTGESFGDDFDWDWATVAYEVATGARRWLARYDAPGGLTIDKARAVAVTPDGTGVAVTGLSMPVTSAGWDYGTVVYDPATGAPAWSALYDPGNGDDQPTALVVTPDSATVVVTGRSGLDYATVAYAL